MTGPRIRRPLMATGFGHVLSIIGMVLLISIIVACFVDGLFFYHSAHCDAVDPYTSSTLICAR